MSEVKKVPKGEKVSEVSADELFQKDAKLFMVDMNTLQKKYNIVLRPVITLYGPDLNLSRPEEEEQKEELMKK